MSKIIKHGLNYKFNNGEYIKIDPLYKDATWFTKTPYKIINFCKKTSYTFEDFYKLDSTNMKRLNFSLVIQDNECLKLNRKQKLKKILNETKSQ